MRPASSYVSYELKNERFSLSEEQSFTLADEGSPAFFPGAFQIAVAQFKVIPKMVQAMLTGLGVGWHEHGASLFLDTERFFRPGYAAMVLRHCWWQRPIRVRALSALTTMSPPSNRHARRRKKPTLKTCAF